MIAVYQKGMICRKYRQTSNIRGTEFQNINVFRLVLAVAFAQSIETICLVDRRYSNDIWGILPPTNVRLILRLKVLYIWSKKKQ